MDIRGIKTRKEEKESRYNAFSFSMPFTIFFLNNLFMVENLSPGISSCAETISLKRSQSSQAPYSIPYIRILHHHLLRKTFPDSVTEGTSEAHFSGHESWAEPPAQLRGLWQAAQRPVAPTTDREIPRCHKLTR